MKPKEKVSGGVANREGTSLKHSEWQCSIQVLSKEFKIHSFSTKLVGKPVISSMKVYSH